MIRRLIHLIRSVVPRRFVVADRSMEPTLVDGQGIIAIGFGTIRVGQLRTFEHPHRPGFWLVKRVAAVSGNAMIVESDNTAVDTIDSNTFGPVDVAGSYRVLMRIPLRFM